MMTRRDVSESLTWFRRHRRDEEVARCMLQHLAKAGHASAQEYARLDPDGFVQFVDFLADVVEQIPEDQLRSASGHALRDGTA